VEGELTGPEIRVHSELAWAALDRRLDREYRLWLLLRSMSGSGKVPLNSLEFPYRGLAPVTVKKILQRGEGVFWTVRDSSVWYYKLTRVCAALGVSYVSPSVIAEFPEKLKEFRALCTFAFARYRDTPISQQTLAKAANRTDRTIRNYVKALPGLEVTPNYAHASCLGEGTFADRETGELLRAMPNSYDLPVGRGGSTRKVNRELRNLAEQVATRTRRRYFRDPSKAQKRMQALEEGDWFYVHDKDNYWTRWSVANGALWA